MSAASFGPGIAAIIRSLFLMLLTSTAVPSAAGVPAGQNLLTEENGARVVGFSSEYGGWSAASMVPSLARLAEPGVSIEDFIWCTADNAPFPHWVKIELKSPQWITTFVFNNALKEESAYPGISARQIEVWAGDSAPDRLTRVASFQLERNRSGQSVRIEPMRARWIRLVILSNWGHPMWTELNATAAIDDGSRPTDPAAQLRTSGKADLYGIYFDFASADLRPESRPTLERILAIHRQTPGDFLVVEGHTDDVGSASTNADLSLRRARAVVAALGSMGARIGSFQAIGRGAAEPVADNGSEAGRARNRRVTLRLGKEAPRGGGGGS